MTRIATREPRQFLWRGVLRDWRGQRRVSSEVDSSALCAACGVWHPPQFRWRGVVRQWHGVPYDSLVMRAARLMRELRRREVERRELDERLALAAWIEWAYRDE